MTTYDPLSVASIQTPRGWDVFPNPTKDGTVKWRGTLPSSYSLFDAQGRVVQLGNLPPHTTSWVIELPVPGVYMLRGSDGQTAGLVRK